MHKQAAEIIHDDRIDYLDGWRGIAILLVLQSHFLPVSNWVDIDSGRLGVDAFFCLSGLLMSNILFIKRTPLRDFHIRRASRILPAFLCFTTIVFSIGLIAYGDKCLNEFIPTILFIRTYTPVSPHIWDAQLPIQHLWSLNVEEHSYVLLSVLAYIGFSRLRTATWILVIAFCSITISILYVKFPAFAPAMSGLRTEVAASFIFFSAGYNLWLKSRPNRKLGAVVPILVLVLAVTCYFESVNWWIRSILPPVLLGITVNHLGDTPQWFRAALSSKVLCSFGMLSYSIYLWQQPFYVYSKSHPQTQWLALGASIAVGILSFYLVEKPARISINRRFAVAKNRICDDDLSSHLPPSH